MKFPALSKFALLLGSSLLAQVTLLAGSIVFARLYSPEAFGLLAQITAIASIATVVTGLRFDHMAFSRNEAQKAELFSAAFLVMSVGSAAMSLAGFVLWQADEQAGADFLWVILFVMANGAYYLCSQWQIARGNYSAYGRLRIVQAMAYVGIGAALFASLPSKGMLVAAIVSQAAAALLIMRDASRKHINVYSGETLNCVRSNFKGAAVNSMSALLQYSTPLAPMIIGPFFLDKGDIGAYFLFSSALAAPGAILRRAILSYFNGEIKSPDHLRQLIVRTTARFGSWMLIGAIVFAACIALLHFNADTVTRLLFGNAWQQYAGLLVPLFLFFALDTLLQPFSTFLGMWGREGAQVSIETLRFALTYGVWPLIVFAVGYSFFEAINIYLVLMASVYILNCTVAIRARTVTACLAGGKPS